MYESSGGTCKAQEGSGALFGGYLWPHLPQVVLYGRKTLYNPSCPIGQPVWNIQVPAPPAGGATNKDLLINTTSTAHTACTCK